MIQTENMHQHGQNSIEPISAGEVTQREATSTDTNNASGVMPTQLAKASRARIELTQSTTPTTAGSKSVDRPGG